MSNLERTLVLLKPDAVKRGLSGAIIGRFERAGLKIVASKLVTIDKTFAEKHYFDIAERRGAHVLAMLVDFMTSGPIWALAIEGVEAAENVRRLIGETQPKTAAPGTIRGDYSHTSYRHSDATGKAIQNLVHASGNSEEAKFELGLWFTDAEYCTYALAHESETLG